MTTTTFTERVGLAERTKESYEKNHAALSAKLKADEWIDELDEVVARAKALDARQEALKAEQKATTAELNAVGLRTAADSPETHEHLRPQLVPYAWLVFDPGGIWLGLALGNAFVVMLIVLVCANVALLMFARAATRENEIAVRSALGASRARIVTQLFVEALVLAGVAVAVGLAAARVGLRSLSATMEAERGQPLRSGWATA